MPKFLCPDSHDSVAAEYYSELASKEKSMGTRRDFLQTAAVMGVGLIANGRVGNRDLSKAMSAVSDAESIVMMDGVSLSKAIHSKAVSCREVISTYLDHIARINPKVNAIVSLQDRDALLKQAEERDAQLSRGESMGWMHGFPHAVKDLEATKGIRTSYGSPLEDGVPDHDAIVVERLRNNGAILIGKTNVPEFGLGSQSYNPIFGVTRNAYDQTKTAGGSSGGAAVSLALRMLPVADGSDYMGSLRNPSAFNNVIGFRPSFGRVPEGPGGEIYLASPSTAGPMGRSVRDVAMLLSVIGGPDERVPLSIEQDPATFTRPLERDFRGTKLGWLGDLGGRLPFEPGILDLCKQSFKAFESFGCTVEEAQPNYSMELLWQTHLTIRHWLIAARLGGFYADPAKRAKLKSEAQWEVEGGLGLTGADVSKAFAARTEWYAAARRLFSQFDYLLIPSAQVFPFDAALHWPKSINGVAMDTYHRWMEVVVPATLLDCPVIGVPVGFNAEDLPMGVQIIGKNHADFAVLQIAYAYEQATHWVQKQLPPLLKAKPQVSDSLMGVSSPG
jgi:amidase